MPDQTLPLANFPSFRYICRIALHVALQHKGRRDRTPVSRRSLAAEDLSMPCRNPWFTLSRDAMMLGLESQTVIGLRLIKAVMGGDAAQREAALMVTEKAQAMVDAQFVLAESLLAGEPHLGPSRAVALFRKRVQANQRRLGRGQ